MAAAARRQVAVNQPAEPVVTGELFVVVACHAFACAIATRWIVRLVLANEVAAPQNDILSVDGRPFFSWDLGKMLDLPALGDAWVLLRVPFGDDELALALRTGTCLTVQPLSSFTQLPPGLFRTRRGAIPVAFAGKDVKGRADALVGLCFDPGHAWAPAELEKCAQALSRARK